MTNLPQIQSAIQQLTTDELKQLADWLTEYRQSRWDEQIEGDVNTGRLDELGEQLKSAYDKGETSPL